MIENKYFFCYNKDLADKLRYGKGIKYVTVALHEKTGCKFWLFERTTELDIALTEING